MWLADPYNSEPEGWVPPSREFFRFLSFSVPYPLGLIYHSLIRYSLEHLIFFFLTLWQEGS